MTTGGDELFVTVGGRDIGLADLLRRVEKEMAQNADSAVRLGQSYGRLATAQGRPALASQVLAGTMQRAGSASERALIGIQTQAARTNTGLAVLPRTIAGLSHEAASMATGMLGLGTAISVTTSVVNSFAEAFKFKAQLDATTLAINAQIKGIRDSGQVYAEADAFASKYKLTQEETTNAISASIGVMRASKAPMEDILGVLARMQVLSPEQSLQEAAIALKALASGDTTSLVTRFEVGRDVANQMKQEIQGGADAVAVMSKFLGDTGIGMDVLAAKTQGAAGEMKNLAIAQEELKFAQAAFAQGPGLVILQGQIQATTGATRVLTGDFNAMGQSIQNNAALLGANAAAFQAYIGALAGGATAAEANSIAVNAQANATAFLTGVQRDGGGGAFEFATATNVATNALLGESTSAAAATAAIQAHDATLTSDAAASQLATVQAQELALRKEALAQAAQLAAQNLLASGAAGAYAAAQLANSSSQVDVLTAAYYRLAAAQAAAAQAKTNAQAFTDQRAGERDAGSARTAAQITFAADQDRKAQASRLRRAEEAERALKKVRGGGGGGGGGAAVKLTDQQKLENQLLTSQEQFSTKSEDAERAHLNRILDINADFAERMKDAQESFAQSQLEGRAGFYNSLGSIEDAGLRQALSAQYEAAFAEADKIAQERGADVGEKFLAAKQAAIEAQAKRASEIAEAQKAGDKDKAEYLAGVDRLYREAEERKLKAITEGQDSLAAQRDKQIADEAGQYAASQDKIGAAADTAAERKILAAERAGKAIDAEAIKVDGLANKYNGLGAAGARAGITPTPAFPSATNTQQQPAQTATGPAAEGPTLSDLITGLMGKIEDLKSALVGAEKSGADQVSGAVRSLGNSLVR